MKKLILCSIASLVIFSCTFNTKQKSQDPPATPVTNSPTPETDNTALPVDSNKNGIMRDGIKSKVIPPTLDTISAH